MDIHPLDVSDKAALVALPEEVVDRHGAVHILVNNAGVACDASFEMDRSSSSSVSSGSTSGR